MEENTIKKLKLNPFKYFGYYVKQSRSKLIKDWLTIVCITLSLSMVSGISYFLQSAQKHQFENSFSKISDFTIHHLPLFDDNSQLLPKINFSLYFSETDAEIQKQLKYSDLDLNGTFKYGLFGIDIGYFSNNQFSFPYSNCTSKSQFLNRLNVSNIKFGLFESDFYNSTRFNRYFKIIKGKVPKNKNEFLVDLNFAKKYSLIIGKYNNLSLQMGRVMNASPPITNFKKYKMNNINITGYYLPIQSSFYFALQKYEYSFTYDNYLKNNSYKEIETYDAPLVFSYENFSNPIDNHPIQNLYYTIFEDSFYRGYLEDRLIKSGYILAYNRQKIDFNKLYFYKTLIAQQAVNISIHMPFKVSCIDILSYQLKYIYRDLQKTHLLVQLLNIPMIIFSILISKNFSKSKKEKIDEELILLRLRSVPIKIIKRQILITTFIRSILCTIFGLLLGLLSFFIFESVLGKIFYDPDKVKIYPYISKINILITFLVGIIMNIISTIPKIWHISKYKYSEISNSLKTGEFSCEYDEDLFIKNKKKPSFIHQIKTHIKRKKENKYLINIKEKSKNEIYYQYIIILLGLIPLFLYLIIYIRYNFFFDVPDTIIDISQTLIDHMFTLQIFSFFGIGFLISGIINLLIKKKPGILARLFKNIAKFFTKKYNHIIGLELLRQKKWSYILKYFSIFIGLLISSNILYNSQYRYENLNDNMYIGSDIQVKINNPNFSNQNDIEKIEQNLQQLNFENNNTTISKVLTCNIAKDLYFVPNEGLNSENEINLDFNLYSLDILKYIDIIKNDGKPLPYRRFSTDLKKISNETNNFGTFIPIITSTNFLIQSNMHINDYFHFKHFSFNSITNETNSSDIYVKIINTMDFIPGIYNDSSSVKRSIIIDKNYLNKLKSILHGDSFIQLLDLNSIENINLVSITNDLNLLYSNCCKNPIFNFYNQDWDQKDKIVLSLDFESSGFYGLEYNNFILIGILLIIELSLTIITISKENSYFNGMLLIRGVGKKDIQKMVIIKTLTVYSIAIILGAIIGTLYGGILSKVNQKLLAYSKIGNLPRNLNLPIYINVLGISSLIFLITAISLTTIYFGYKINKKKEIKKSIQIFK